MRNYLNKNIILKIINKITVKITNHNFYFDIEIENKAVQVDKRKLKYKFKSHRQINWQSNWCVAHNWVLWINKAVFCSFIYNREGKKFVSIICSQVDYNRTIWTCEHVAYADSWIIIIFTIRFVLSSFLLIKILMK